MDCSTTFQLCADCTASACSNCQSPAVASGIGCVCPLGYYSNGAACQTCSSLLGGCLDCSDATTCLTCDTANNFILNNGQCECDEGYFLNSSGGCQTCASVLIGCSACSSEAFCTSCLSASNFLLQPNNTCACQPMYIASGSSCVSCLTSCNCYGYQWDPNGVCAPFCSDSITVTPVE